jgi:hypothetical protein
MTSLRVGRLREARWVRIATIVVAVISLATVLCLFDRGEDGSGGHVMRPDCCPGMLVVSLGVMPLAALLAAGWVGNLPVTPPFVVAPHIPDPPPRSTSLF